MWFVSLKGNKPMLTILLPAIICFCQTPREKKEWWCPVLWSRWCSTEIPAHSLHRAGAMQLLLECDHTVWHLWLVPVTQFPGNSCPMALYGLWHNSGSSHQYTVWSMMYLSILIWLSHRNPAGSSPWQLVLCEENPSLWPALDTQCTLHRELDSNQTTLVRCQIWGNEEQQLPRQTH